MWEAGLVDEVRGLESLGLREGRTASRALGYQQVLAALAGECTEDEARAETVRATKRFARRRGLVVPARPARPVAEWRRGRPRRTPAPGAGVGRTSGYSLIA